MASVGIDANTGKLLVGWPHVVQSIGKLLTTSIGSRVERRDFGSLIPSMIDRPQNQDAIVNFIMATAEALEPRLVRGRWYGEPRFHLTRAQIGADVPATVTLLLSGDYIPNGHKGDFSKRSPTTLKYSVNRMFADVSFESLN